MKEQRRAFTFFVIACLLAACGGGSDVSTTDQTPGTGVAPRAPLPSLSTDTNPSGARIDVASSNYFPATINDRWAYDILLGTASTRDSTLSRAVTAVETNGNVAIAETYQNTTDIQVQYRRTAEGVSVLPLSSSVPQVVQDQVGRLLQYPEPFYAVGRERVVVRQGSWGADLDGDGFAESFRFEFRQTLTSIGTLTVASQTIADVAQFSNVITLMVQPSDASYEPYTVTTLENAWWAPGIGLVRYDRRDDDSDGDVVTSPYTLLLTGGVVAGEALFAPKPDGVLTKIVLLHNDLVYDSRRGVYYASVPGSQLVNGNRIAIINASTGEVSYSAAAVGLEPGELAVSADGSALYVGLNGSSEVAKFSLPELTEQWRVELPLPSIGTPDRLIAGHLAVPRQDSGLVAVATALRAPSFGRAGVLLIRDGVILTGPEQMARDSNQIAFDGSGQFLYGYNADTTEFGLRRFAVLSNGFLEEAMVETRSSFGPQSLEWAGDKLVIGLDVYQTPALSLAGALPSDTSVCVWTNSGSKLVCASDAVLVVLNGATLNGESSPRFKRVGEQDALHRIVAGPLGTVALRMNTTATFGALAGSSYAAAADIWLFKSPALE